MLFSSIGATCFSRQPHHLRKWLFSSRAHMPVFFTQSNVLPNCMMDSHRLDRSHTSDSHASSIRSNKRLPSSRNGIDRFDDAARLLQDRLAIQGELRTLSRSLAFVEHPVDKKRVLIFGSNRNQAMAGDLVVVRLFPIGCWKVIGTQTAEPALESPTDPFISTSSEYDAPLEESDTSGTRELTTSSEENLETEFVDLPTLTRPTLDAPPNPKEFYRLPNKYQSFFQYKSLNDIAVDSRNICWPTDLPERLKLSSCRFALSPLPSSKLIRTGRVVAIMQKNPRSRRLLGRIAFFRPRLGRITRHTVPIDSDASTEGAVCLFVPNNNAHSLVKLEASKLPKGIGLQSLFPPPPPLHHQPLCPPGTAILDNRALGMKTNHVCKITGWNERMNLPSGALVEQLGDMNEIEPATQRILLEYGLRDKEFLPEHLKGLPTDPEEFTIPKSELTRRRDFRSCCVMSIDPASAKDIDDALHIKSIGPDLFEVGIHIADVSHFVRPGTPLDQEASERTTSIYLVQRAIPMLPPILSEHLCSLQPNKDRLAFSVVMRIRGSGEILQTWFGKSIIRSRLKMSYDHALALLETCNLDINDEKVQSVAKLIPTPEAPFDLTHVRSSLVMLNDIARNLRRKRIEHGALTLQKAKMEFDIPSATFDPDPMDEIRSDLSSSPLPSSSSASSTSQSDSKSSNRTIWPRGYSFQSPGPSHQLIEEWMLAANQAVARRLFEAFRAQVLRDTQSANGMSNQAKTTGPAATEESEWAGILLRKHSAPSTKDLNDLTRILEAGGIQLSSGTSKDISDTLQDHNRKMKESGIGDQDRNSIMDALSHLVYVRMQMATYFSADELIALEPELFQRQSNLPLQGFLTDPLLERTWHYGLNVPLYTHFTSPIRRYADLLVHRQLARVLNQSNGTRNCSANTAAIRDQVVLRHARRRVGTQLPPLVQLASQAAWCNNQRMMTRRAQDASQNLFLTACLRDCGSMLMDATVIQFNANTIKLLLSTFGMGMTCQLKQFLSPVENWRFISGDQLMRPTSTSSDPNLSSVPSRTGQKIHASWSLDSTLKDSSTTTTNNSATSIDIGILSVIPCRVYCQSDELVLRAEFAPHQVKST